MRRPPLSARLKRTLISGLLIVAPISLTLMVLAYFVALVDSALAPVSGLIGREVPGLGFAVAIVLVLAAGALAENMAGQHLIEVVEELLLKVPVFNWIYRNIKQVADAFGKPGKEAFRRVVLVEYPRPDVLSLGFVTNEVTVERGRGRETLTCVYVPSNHMYIGEYMLVPEKDLHPTALTVQEGIQCALSAGASLPKTIQKA